MIIKKWYKFVWIIKKCEGVSGIAGDKSVVKTKRQSVSSFVSPETSNTDLVHLQVPYVRHIARLSPFQPTNSVKQ